MSIRAWAELLRASNAPTIVTNGLAATALAAGTVDAARAVVAIGGAVLLYFGGMVLNDVADARIDARERPGRPIPSGRVPRGAAAAVSIALLGFGAAAISLAGTTALPWTLALVASIVAYDLLRIGGRRFALAMAACRGLLYPALAAVHGPVGAAPLLAGGVVLLHTLAITLAAREEAAPRRAGNPAAWLLVAGPALLLAAPIVEGGPRAAAIALAVGATVWLALAAGWSASTSRSPVRGVLAAIAGFCLLDAIVLARAGWASAMVASLACFGVTLLAHRRILGT